MATCKELPSGQWNLRGFYKNSITGEIFRPSFTAASKTEVKRMYREWEAEKESTESRDMTVSECIEKYITVKTSALSPATIAGYRRIQRNRFESIGSRKLRDLTDADLQSYVSTLCEKYSPKTVRNSYALLIASVNMFSKKQFSVTLPSLIPKEYHIPTDEDVRELIKSASNTLRLAICLAAIGTLREGEISAIYYHDVDYENGGLWVRRDMVKDERGNWVIKEIPKTASSVRFVPLPESVMKMIGIGEPDELIYKKRPTTTNHNFARLRDKLGLRCRFHDLRHYSASILHALGVPDQYIMERGGWRSDNVLKAVYRNTLSDQTVKFARISNEHFGTLL